MQKKPESQLYHGVSQFIYDYDGPHRDHLLIVYYCGHAHIKDEEGVSQLYIAGYVQ